MLTHDIGCGGNTDCKPHPLRFTSYESRYACPPGCCKRLDIRCPLELPDQLGRFTDSRLALQMPGQHHSLRPRTQRPAKDQREQKHDVDTAVFAILARDQNWHMIFVHFVQDFD